MACVIMSRKEERTKLLMCVHIRIEVLAASAIIGLIKCTGKKFVSFKKLDEYGVKVAQKLQSENETAYWVYSREQVDAMFADYTDLFERSEEDGFEGIRLRDNVSSEDLIKRFILQLTKKLELVLMDPEVLEVFKKAA